MSNYNLSIYTPNGVVVEKLQCNELCVPTESGMINILKGHTHMLSNIDTGILTARIDHGQARHFTMAGGLLKVLGNTVTVLAKTSEHPEQIDIERAQAAKHKAESRLKEPLPTVVQLKFQRKLERAKNRLKLANLK